MAQPRTLMEAIRYVDPDVCVDFVAGLRWPHGPTCPGCGCTEYSFLTTRRLWKCKGCKKQYSVKLGSLFEDSAIPLEKWLTAIWVVANSTGKISSHELGRSVGITQKSAWFVLRRIRVAMQAGSFDPLDGPAATEYHRFLGLAQRLVRVPKAELDEAAGRDRVRGASEAPNARREPSSS